MDYRSTQKSQLILTLAIPTRCLGVEVQIVALPFLVG